LLDVTATLTASGLGSVLGVFYDSFIWAILILVILLGIAMISSNISLELESRRKDIGLMKSIGTLVDTIFDHFMAQGVILLLAGVVLGVVVGTVLYFLGLLWISFSVTGIDFTFIFPWLQVTFIVVVLLIAGYFSAQKPIFDAVHESPIRALNPEIGTKVRRVGYLDTFGLPFRVATKGTGRRIKGTRRTLITLFLSFSLASILWIGGGVVQTTMDTYVVRSMGSNVVAVGNPGLLEQYYGAYSLDGTPLNDSFSFLNTSDIIPANLVTEIGQILGVIKTESRLVDYTTVSERAGVVWNPTLNQYELVGKGRSSSILVEGVDWHNSISNWYYESESGSVSGSKSVWLGGQVASTMFEDPFVQSLGVRGQSFEVQAITFDVGNGGMMAMIPLDEMMTLWGVSGGNLLLVQVSEYSNSVISQIETLANQYGFSIYRQQDVLDHNLNIINAYWGLIQPLPVMALIAAFLNLMYYLLISIFGRFHDYVIMRSIGAKPSFIAKTMMAEGVDIGLKAGIPAIIVSSIFSIFFLVPEATLPSISYLPVTGGLILATLLLVVVIAAIPVYFLFQSRGDLRVSEFPV
jgi:ABC-type antimicrobial peptide transport system permease subunit